MVNQSTKKTADQGDVTSGARLKKMLKRLGSRMIAPVMSAFGVSGEHNYYTIRLKTDSALPQANQIEGIIEFSKANEKILRKKLNANRFILGESKLPLDDPRVVRLIVEEMEMAEHTRSGELYGIEGNTSITN